MRIHRIKIKGMPQILHAHEHASDKYAWQFPITPNFMEVSYRLENAAYVTHGDLTEKVLPRSVCVSCRTEPSSAYSDGFQRHVTVGFWIDWEPVAPGEEDDETLILPGFSILPNSEWYLKTLREIVEEFTIKRVTTPALSAKILTMLARIHEEYRVLTNTNYSEVRYVEDAKRYIAAHLDEKLYVAAVAEHVGLSVGYLSNLFKKVTGQTLIEYANVTKLRFVKELMNTYGFSIREAGQRAGFFDENYVSRIYKKYFGKNISEA